MKQGLGEARLGSSRFFSLHSLWDISGEALSNKWYQIKPGLPKGLFLRNQEMDPIICLSFLFFILFGRQKSTTTFIFCIVCIVKNWKINLVSSPNELPIPSGRHSETDLTSQASRKHCVLKPGFWPASKGCLWGCLLQFPRFRARGKGWLSGMPREKLSLVSCGSESSMDARGRPPLESYCSLIMWP